MNVVETYQGVHIIESCGFFYPEVNGNAEFASIQEVRDWIDNIYLYVCSNLDWLSSKMELPSPYVHNFFFNVMN